jgi:hypothetical protein
MAMKENENVSVDIHKNFLRKTWNKKTIFEAAKNVFSNHSKTVKIGRHDNHHSDIQHNDAQHNGLIYNTQHKLRIA